MKMKYKVMGWVIQWSMDGRWDTINYIDFNRIAVDKRLSELQIKYPKDKFRIVDIKAKENFLEKELVE